MLTGKGKVCIQAKWPIWPALISGFCGMRRLGVFLLPPEWDASPSQGYPQHLICRYHLYTWVERGTVRVITSVLPKNTTQSPRPLGSNLDRLILR